MKLEYNVVYENSSDELDIEHHRIKFKVTVSLQKFSPFTMFITIQTVRSYNSALAHVRNLRFSGIAHLTSINMDSISQLWNMS